MNVTGVSALQDEYHHTELGIYDFTSTLYKIGVYKFNVYLQNDDLLYEKIRDSPFYLEVFPNEPSPIYSLISGSGVNKIMIGRVEYLYLQVRDIYDNEYHQTKFMDNNVYTVSVVLNETDSRPINLTSSKPNVGIYNFVFSVLDFYVEGTVTVQIYSLNVETGEYMYQNVIGSPFIVPVGFLDLEYYESYNDLTKSGFGVTKLSDIFLMPNIVLAGENFQVRVYPRNGQGANFVYFEKDATYFMYQYTPLVDPLGLTMETQCNCRSDFQRFCSFFSHSKDECLKMPACIWIHGDTLDKYKPSYGSCAPCSNGCNSTNLEGIKQPYFDPRLQAFNPVETSDNMFYYFDANLHAASHYLMTIAAFRIGQLTVTLYDNDDFTNFMFTQNIHIMNITFDEHFHQFFKDRDQKYSAVIQGMVRMDYSNPYNITVITNKDVKLYFDQKLVFSKAAETKDTHTFQLELERHKLIHFEAFISDKQLEPEYLSKRGYFAMYEECGNTLNRLWKPKNIFQFQHIIGSQVKKLRVDASYAYLPNCEVFEVDQQVIPHEENLFRAGKILNFIVKIRDQYNNYRGVGYSDIIEANITLNDVAESSVILLDQDQLTGEYKTTYQFKGVGIYVIRFYINGYLMDSIFSFESISDYISPIHTETLLQGYLTLSETDCMFVNRPFFVVFTMRDQFNNPIPFFDRDAYLSVIRADLALGIFYENQRCQRYSSESIDRIQCQFEALQVGDDQLLGVYSSLTNEYFSGFPIAISVQPYKQEDFRNDGQNQIEKVSEKSMDESGETYSVSLNIIAKDVYGNLMPNDNICSYFAHSRFVVFFNHVFQEAQPSNYLSLIKISVNETFDVYKNLKTIKIMAYKPYAVTFTNIWLNYTLIDGMNYKNGLLVKYYSNNNFLGKPLFITRIHASYIGSDEYKSNWYTFHKEFKEFSVKMTTLLYIPQDTGRRLSFITGFSQRFQLFVNERLVIPEGITTGSIDIYGDGQWVRIKMLYRFSGNKVGLGVPQFLVQWQSEKISLAYIENNPSGAITIAIDPDDKDETLLLKDYFKITRNIFKIMPPIETSYPSTTQIIINWDPIIEKPDATEEKILYYSLEWDQGPIQEWEELTTSGSIQFTHTLTSGFEPAITYGFRVRAKDLYGYGPYSSILYVVPKTFPDKMEIPTTVIEGTDVKISWVEPFGNGADVIKYRVYIQRKDGQFIVEDEYCSENNQTMIEQMNCYIPMRILVGPKYGLVKYDYVIAKAQGGSFIAYGPLSDPNIFGAKVEGTPLVPGTPKRGTATSHLILHVDWPSIIDFTSESGGDTCEIISYNLQWDHGDPIANEWYDLKGYTTDDKAITFQTDKDIVGGTVYRVRVRAKNKHGWGDFSPIVKIIAALVPGITPQITIFQDYQSVQVTWIKPDINGLEITEYDIMFMKKDGTFAYSDFCLGNNAQVLKLRRCTMTFWHFRNEFGLVLNDLIVMKIRAYNAYGWGKFTQNTQGALIKTEPQKPPIKVRRGFLTEEKLIQILWSPLTGDYTGKEQILSYEIWWDAGTDGAQYEELHLARAPFTYFLYQIEYPNVLPGKSYKFMYRGTNQQGIGAFSDPADIAATDFPKQMSPIVTQNLGTDVKVTWVKPYENSSPITKYKVQFKNEYGTLYEILQYCDGSDPVIFAQLYCTIPMSVFSESPYNLAVGALISGVAEAYNDIGYSFPSLDNTAGATFRSAPTVAISGYTRGSLTSKTAIEFSWTALSSPPQNGGETVEYRILWNQGEDIDEWVTLLENTNGLNYYYDNILFTTGKAYSFKVYAYNLFGQSPEPALFTIKTAIAPSGLASPTTVFDTNKLAVLVSWEPPSDDGGLGQASLVYSVEIKSLDGSQWNLVDLMNDCDATIAIDPLFTFGCWIHESLLMQSYYGLTYQSLVLARITVQNEIGSVTSDEGGSAILSDPPSPPPPEPVTPPPTPIPDTTPTTPPASTDTTTTTP